jgi:quinol monooxygenase YgiN
MIYTGKAQFSMTISGPPELEDEGDRIFEEHANWMERTHYREGNKALLQYNVAKDHDEEGNFVFILTEVYETAAGIQDHIEQAQQNWESYGDWSAWTGKCDVRYIGGSEIIHSLW